MAYRSREVAVCCATGLWGEEEKDDEEEGGDDGGACQDLCEVLPGLRNIGGLTEVCTLPNTKRMLFTNNFSKTSVAYARIKPGIGIVHDNINFHRSETDSPEREKLSSGKEIGGTSFSSTPNTRETYGVRSHMATACLSHLIVNTAAGCY